MIAIAIGLLQGQHPRTRHHHRRQVNWRLTTIIILWSNLALLVASDILANRKGGVEATISRVLYDGCRAYIGLAIVVGGLLGHLFFSQRIK